MNLIKSRRWVEWVLVGDFVSPDTEPAEPFDLVTGTNRDVTDQKITITFKNRAPITAKYGTYFQTQTFL